MKNLLEKEGLGEEEIEDDLEQSNKLESKYVVVIDLPKLRNILNELYDLDELRTLCFDLGIEFENLGEGGKDAKVRELLLKLKRQGEILRLILELPKQNPHISWEELQ